jgi:hypothetical protein
MEISSADGVNLMLLVPVSKMPFVKRDVQRKAGIGMGSSVYTAYTIPPFTTLSIFMFYRVPSYSRGTAVPYVIKLRCEIAYGGKYCCISGSF